MPRDHVRCYFGRADVQSCLTSDRKPGDPFHIEAVLVDLALPRLRTDAFSGTQHDRGHMAPNHAFGWHLCGPDKTFRMANMAAQRDYLNRIAARESEINSQLPPNIIGRAPVSASTHAEYLPCHSLA